MFEMQYRDAAGRIGKIATSHGIINTPVLLPVINPNIILISPSEMEKKFGAEAVITNSYIIYKSEKHRKKALKEGLHKLLDFDKPIMTDSGTFQSYVYGDIDVKSLEIVMFQRDIGSDIGTVLDVFTTPEKNHSVAEKDVNETISRVKEAVPQKGKMALACTVQGGLHLDLRKRCAEELSKLDCDIHPIGGVVPLMESYRYQELVDVIMASKQGLLPSRPVHLFGAGHPMIFALAVALGCDIFDSSSYAKYADGDRLMYVDGTRRLNELIESPCSCPVCNKYPVEELKKMGDDARKKIIAEHNLYASFSEIKAIKEAIYEGRLWELVEQRCRCHPALLSALKRLGSYTDLLERFEPISKSSAFFYTGPESMHRPSVLRYQKRFFERYQHPPADVLICFQEGAKPYGRHYKKEIEKVSAIASAHVIINSFFGPVPIELDEMYPIAQSVLPNELDKETIESMNEIMKKFSHESPYKISIMWDGEKTLESLEKCSPPRSKKDNFDIDTLRIKAVSDVQFGKGASNALFNGEIKLIKSKTTGKIRNVFCNNEHILSMRAEDGLFTLKIPGAVRLHKNLKYPSMRVAIHDEDVMKFIQEGKNVFAKFVVDCDNEIRPGDEVLIVDKKDKLIGVGRALMNREEMLSFKRGVAVKTREGVKK
ncbi:MAG: tRNA guanosine(15) transglycosylase TgtA [Thermoplasmata archaeon]